MNNSSNYSQNSSSFMKSSSQNSTISIINQFEKKEENLENNKEYQTNLSKNISDSNSTIILSNEHESQLHHFAETDKEINQVPQHSQIENEVYPQLENQLTTIQNSGIQQFYKKNIQQISKSIEERKTKCQLNNQITHQIIQYQSMDENLILMNQQLFINQNIQGKNESSLNNNLVFLNQKSNHKVRSNKISKNHKNSHQQQNIYSGQQNLLKVQQEYQSIYITISDDDINNNDDNHYNYYDNNNDSNNYNGDENNDGSSQSLQMIDKNSFSKSKILKPKKQSKNKSEKMKYKEYQVVSPQKYDFIIDQHFSSEQEQKYFQNLTKCISELVQFNIFCDIYIEHKYIMGITVEQSKRSDLNNFKQINQIVEHNNSNLFELNLSSHQDTLMEFESCQKYLLSLKDQYAKQVSDSLSYLLEKSQLAKEAIQQIQQNRSAYEYILKRKEHSQQVYEKFKMETLPNFKYYIYNRYVFDIRTGNLTMNDVGYSKDFIKIIGINNEFFKACLSKYGLLEYFKRAQKEVVRINYFSKFLFNMRNMPKLINYIIDFITLDNIEIKLNVEQRTLDLCKEFDDLNSFDCPFIDFIVFTLPQISEEVEESLTYIRQEQNIDINTLLEMNQDEIDFYYNYNSQQFLKKYYSEIYNKNIDSPNLSHQKLDFTKTQM